MIKFEPSISKISMVFIIAGFLSLSIVGCGGGSGGTDSDPGPDPDPDPPPQGQSFDSGNLSPGETFSFTFDTEDMIEYICTIHPEMEGSVTIEDGAGSEQDTVIIDNLEFMPSDITIAPGTEVTWINQDDVAHTSTSQ